MEMSSTRQKLLLLSTIALLHSATILYFISHYYIHDCIMYMFSSVTREPYSLQNACCTWTCTKFHPACVRMRVISGWGWLDVTLGAHAQRVLSVRRSILAPRAITRQTRKTSNFSVTWRMGSKNKKAFRVKKALLES